MEKVIYISGPITDNRTGLPREGWEKSFRDAEEMLKGKGFLVINPVRLAKRAENDWEQQTHSVQKDFDTRLLSQWPHETPRWFYLRECLVTLSAECLTRYVSSENVPELVGLWAIGRRTDILRSFGTMCEINFALSAGLYVWSQYRNGGAVDNMLFPDVSKPTLDEIRTQIINEKK